MFVPLSPLGDSRFCFSDIFFYLATSIIIMSCWFFPLSMLIFLGTVLFYFFFFTFFSLQWDPLSQEILIGLYCVHQIRPELLWLGSEGSVLSLDFPVPHLSGWPPEDFCETWASEEPYLKITMWLLSSCSAVVVCLTVSGFLISIMWNAGRCLIKYWFCSTGRRF